MTMKQLVLVSCVGMAAAAFPADAFPFRDAVVAVPDAYIATERPADTIENALEDPDFYKKMDKSRREETVARVYGWGLAAARDLTNALARVTGAKIPLVRESELKGDAKAVIYVGDTAAARAAGIDTAKMWSREYLLRGEKGRAFIAARTGMGASCGVTDFLERFADYWFILMKPGADPFVANPSLAMPVGEWKGGKYGIEVPCVYVGAVPGEDGKDVCGNYLRRICAIVNGELEGKDRLSPRVRSCHSYYCYCDPTRDQAAHPEFFSMMENGHRRGQWNSGTNLCLSNEELREFVYSNLVKFIEADRKANPTNYPCVYDFSENDVSPEICHCRKCRDIIAGYQRPSKWTGQNDHNNGGDAGLQLWFLNPIARKIREKYPDVVIRTFAYVATRGCPKEDTIRPEPNIRIRYVDLYAFCNHLLPLEHPANARAFWNLDNWRRCATDLDIWDYLMYNDSVEFAAEAIAADAKWYATHGIRSIFMEHDFSASPSFELNCFLMGQFYRNPDADLEKLLDVYCRIFGEKGAPRMREALVTWRKVQAETLPEAAKWNIPWRTLAGMERIRKPMAEAYAAETAQPYRARIAWWLASVEGDLLYICRAHPDGRPRLKQLKEDYLRHLDEALDEPLATDLAKGRSWERRERAKRTVHNVGAEFKEMPPELKDVSRDDMICLDYRNIGYNHAGKVEDPTSETGHAVRCAKWEPPFRFGPQCGWFFRNTKGSFVAELPQAVIDGKDTGYHWYHLASGDVEPSLELCLPGGGGVLSFSNIFISERPGKRGNPNRYGVWVSMRYAKLKVAEKKSTTEMLDPDESLDGVELDEPTKLDLNKFGFFVDRILLVRYEGSEEGKK